MLLTSLLNLLLSVSLKFRNSSCVLWVCTSLERPDILLLSAEYTVALADVFILFSLQCYCTCFAGFKPIEVSVFCSQCLQGKGWFPCKVRTFFSWLELNHWHLHLITCHRNLQFYISMRFRCYKWWYVTHLAIVLVSLACSVLIYCE